ncbi:2,3-diketo-5-methylthio-1-phosphopentane phosphatase [Angulomicrobium tetraedrale]|uniref:phosphoserine phosphatase n=1 Tax=Ancylobacter tetraedralis TaxID=217068 RepID=A0A839Z4K1_9HYPH|nr:HAD-IB family phosphatase [Ancylobacter tetraedralis]MBB3769913.1 2,3-diketo-5-methylthio-1-phosphopentane phosphatase [Ancylobacter tetraedralis]
MDMALRPHFAMDFDGTICPSDATDSLFDTFATPEWRAIEDRCVAGEMTSRECISREVELFRATPEELEQAVAKLSIDSDVPDFVAAARRYGATVSVVSDGFDLFIHPLLRAAGLDLPVSANTMLQMGADGWKAAFANGAEGCGSGTCKCKATSGRHPLVLIGDGRSDFCLARRADFVLAKGKLATYCAQEGIPHIAITNFADALALLPTIMAEISPTIPTSLDVSFESSNA